MGEVTVVLSEERCRRCSAGRVKNETGRLQD